MVNIIYNFLVWSSGADKTILEDCPKSEHIKYALQGGLVLIPTILSFGSMLYASALLVDSFHLQLFIAFTWAFIIFIIDRYIVATFVKKKDGKDWYSIQFLLRVIFAIGLGIVISHPIIVRIFEDKIIETQNENWITIKKNSKDEIFTERDIINEKLINRVDSITMELDLLRKVITAEIVGANAVIGGYYVSDKPGSGKRVEKLAQDTLKLGHEKRNVELKIQVNNDLFSQKLEDLLIEKKSGLANGYWGKDDALENYLTKSKKWIKYWFLLIFFVFIDITAVTLKAFTKFGEYDSKILGRELTNVNSKEHYFLRLTEQRKRFFDKNTGWKNNRMDQIFKENENSSSETLKNALNEINLDYENERYNINKQNSFFGPFVKEVKELSKEKQFRIYFISSIIIGIAIALVTFFSGKDVSLIITMLSSAIVQVAVTVIGGIITYSLTVKNKRNE